MCVVRAMRSSIPRPRSKDPLTAAAASILVPALKPLGFQRHGTRKLVRMHEDILHSIDPSYSPTGGGCFYVECWAMPLIPPTDFFYHCRGERLRDEVEPYSLWPAETHERADASMQRVVQLLHERVLPFFETIKSTEAFLALLQSSPEQSHHEHFRVACCMIRLGRVSEAADHLAEAIWQYNEDGRSWCPPYAVQCEQMLGAIGDGTSLELLDKWKAQTIRDLRLEKILPYERMA